MNSLIIPTKKWQAPHLNEIHTSDTEASGPGPMTDAAEEFSS